jgi:hypothetical protein
MQLIGLLKFGVCCVLVLVLSLSGCSGCPYGASRDATSDEAAQRSTAEPQEADDDDDAASGPPLDPSQRAFVERLIAAVSAQDKAAFTELIAPGTRACFTDATRRFLDAWIQQNLDSEIPPDYTAWFESVAPGEISPRRGSTLPVPPTHSLTIVADTPEERIEQTRYVALDRGRWYLVLTCPDRDVERIVGGGEARQQRIAAGEALFARLSPQTQERVRALVSQGQVPQAIAELRDLEGIEPRDALPVIAYLRNEIAGAARGEPGDPMSSYPP